MQNKPCLIESLVTTKYCQLSVYPDCNVVNLNLPSRISLQFETDQFIKTAHAFNQSARLLKTKTSNNKKVKKVITLSHLHSRYSVMKIGLFYGSDTGNTESVAMTLRDEIGENVVDIHEVFNSDLPELITQYDFIILGTPTWYDGAIQNEWAEKPADFDKVNLSGHKVAIYGLGDQQDWGEYFCNAIDELAAKVQESGGTIIGHWSSEEYNFTSSKALIDVKTFVGLTLTE